MPPLKEKPVSPVPPLPVPRHKGRAVLFVVLPLVVGAVMGAIVGSVVRWVTHTDVVWVCVGGMAFLGACLGVRTLFMVLSYGAVYSHEEHISTHGE